MKFDKCECCLNSRAVISENGLHYVCCLSQRAAVNCMTGKLSHFKELVRCKDCNYKSTWYKNEAFNIDICGLSGMCVVEDNDFCSYGERKENG